jgi:hypothetical protein
MKDEIRSKFDAAFAKREEIKQAAADEQKARETKEEAFLRAFLACRESVMRPAMEEVADYVRSKGHSCEIKTEEYRAAAQRERARDASIRITFFTAKRDRPDYEFPGLAILCNQSAENVLFHETTMGPSRGGHAGGAGASSLVDLTADLIQEKVFNVIREVFR